MRILLDTHVFLWALGDPDRIASTRRNELESLANTIYVSSISVAEIMLKVSIGKLSFEFDPIECTEEAGFLPLNYSAADALLLRDLPFHHRDPFDRMLIAQSVAQKLKIMSDDRRFTRYDCDLI